MAAKPAQNTSGEGVSHSHRLSAVCREIFRVALILAGGVSNKDIRPTVEECTVARGCISFETTAHVF